MNPSRSNEQSNAVNNLCTNEGLDYFDYLRKRSILACFYRKYWLYPRLCRHLSGSVLDIGCGIGDLLSFRENTIGVDINPRAVAWCREKGYRAEMMAPGVLPFQAAEFDGVVIDNVLEHITDPQPLLAEARRVLKQNGRLLIGVPGRRGYTCDPDHKVFYDESSLVEILATSRFDLKQLLCMPFKSVWLEAHMRQYCLYGVFQRD